MSEYKRVLAYPHLKLGKKVVGTTLGYIKRLGKRLTPAPSTIPLPHETDRVFYDTAVTAGAYLVTGNMKHYPHESLILSPAVFLDLLDSCT